MALQSDFWKPAPYNFAAVVGRIDFASIYGVHLMAAAEHARATRIRARNSWKLVEASHDIQDGAHFREFGLGRDLDVWDNRRKSTDRGGLRNG
jgi:hypothetical protein